MYIIYPYFCQFSAKLSTKEDEKSLMCTIFINLVEIYLLAIHEIDRIKTVYILSPLIYVIGENHELCLSKHDAFRYKLWHSKALKIYQLTINH